MHQTAASIARCIPSVPFRPAFIPSLHHNLHRISIFHAPERRMGQFLSRGKRDDAGGSQPEPDLWLVVGLGNPGPRYASTRHNVGFMAIDALGKEADVATDRLQANCAVGRGRLAGSKVLLCKPMTFMNVSGEGVGKLSRYYGIDPARIIVIYDDLDMPTGTVRVRAKGGHGGHNGIRSLIQHLGTNEFPRVKVGIARPPEGLPVATYVLQPFTNQEQKMIEEAIVASVLPAVRAAVSLGMEKALSGVRISADGKQIVPPHQNGKGGGGGGKSMPKQATKEGEANRKREARQDIDQQQKTALGHALQAAVAASAEKTTVDA